MLRPSEKRQDLHVLEMILVLVRALALAAPRWLLRDRDGIYGDAFRRRVAGMGIGEVLASPSSPWQNHRYERRAA